MSKGISCTCAERDKPIKERNWEIINYKCNYSAFNGYHYTPSDYSALKCLSCGTVWRTKADYVITLKFNLELNGKNKI